MARCNRVLRDEHGFSLIELLVVILLIGILAAIAIPSFLNQKGKAYDAGAKEVLHAAQAAAESYATDNAGSYANLTASALGRYEPTIQIGSGNGNAYVSSVTNVGPSGYTIVVKPAAGNESFTLSRAGGTLTRSCTVNGAPATGGGCVNGSW